jgi:MerR family transcriptional regulator/heat shock protein HspR
MLDEARPVYTIGTAAEILGVHPRTLRLYEDGGLLRPARKNNRRFYSTHDLEWISCVRYLLHEQGLNQEGLRRLLALVPCWDIRGCAPEAKESCPAWKERGLPCWDLARRGGVKKNGCYKCEAYLSAMDYVLDEDELEEARNYVLAD